MKSVAQDEREDPLSKIAEIDQKIPLTYLEPKRIILK